MPARLLLYSATADFRHDSIPASIEALQAKAASIDVQFDNTEDKSQFNDENLAKYDAVVFLNNSGIVLDEAGKAAFQKYLNLGGNFVGIHCASAALRDSPFYLKTVGAYFDYHPAIQESCVDVIDHAHPSTNMLPEKWRLVDEMYNFQSDPRVFGCKVLLTADESSYDDPGERKFDHGLPHPVAWYQDQGAGVESGGIAGRSWYTSLGHCIEIWHDELFLAHVLGGITWSLQSGTTRAFNSEGKVGNAA
ncbi:hypothetical protein SERLA73DRAFT_73646 [Serpula lacrymans var. lacrymans S7.3]|uniref:ThuA-like domain-containing protein n=1 Tax=Serpula lacrymans var. lacrymans (strain S7.3) TaxID=936435 RepID=F8PYW9_SERL3|nr:hypothetical protein SERLA73DRAFT_73646 [Serpula lacrymans var. lacrymans S7.3]